MQRCIELAKLGTGQVAPNPMVGAVLVHEDRIIAEGWHQQYGQAHAEVNCINAVKEEDRHLIPLSTLYVSLEPCAHFGKTPPCADRIIKEGVRHVVIGCRDPFKQVNGRGIEKLVAVGIHTETGILEHECINLNKRFFTFHLLKRPFIILKWAETADGFIAGEAGQERLLITNEYSNRLVHRWRSEEASILVGRHTAMNDDPQLTTRTWPGNSPTRIVIDRQLQLPSRLQLFSTGSRTIIFNEQVQEEKENLLYYKLDSSGNQLRQMLDILHELSIQSVIVEGGTHTLQSFIDAGLWDEARVICNEDMHIERGLPAPQLSQAIKTGEQSLQSDTIYYYKNDASR